MGLKEKILSIDKKTWFCLLLIFLLGFGIRAHNMKYELFFAFDSYYHARMVTYILQDGVLPLKDPLAYWQIGYSDVPPVGPFFWYFSAAIYKIFTLGAPYDKTLWIQFVKLLPALFGTLTAVALFFFGKELYGKKAGYAMAFVGAASSSFVYRTMAGFFEDDSLGFLWMIVGFVFYARAMKFPALDRKHLFNAVLAGFFLGIMSLTWAFFLVAVLVIVFHFIFSFFKTYKEFSRKESLAFVALFAICFGIFLAFSLISGNDWISAGISLVGGSMPFLGDSATLVVHLFLIVSIALIAVLLFLKKDTADAKSHLPLYVMLLLYGSLILLLIVLSDPGQIFSHKFRPPDSIFANTIGEESFGFPTWGYKFNALIILPIIALILIPYRLFKKKGFHLSIMLFFWIWITLFMTFYKLQYTFTFGLPIAVSAGIIVEEFFRLFNKPKLLEAKVVAIAIGLILLTGVASADFFVKQHPPTIETMPEWKEALSWAKDNTPEHAKFFNWWNWGHWISFLAEKQVFLDNRNSDSAGTSDFGIFITTDDLNQAVKIIKKHQPDYIILSRDLFDMAGSMLVYGYNTMDLGSVPGLSEKIPGFLGIAFDCWKSGSNYSCGPNNMSEAQFNVIPTEWINEPNQIQDGKYPLWVYKHPDNQALIITGYSTNFSTLSKLWFHEDEATKYFEEVFANKKIKIFKVKKEALNEMP